MKKILALLLAAALPAGLAACGEKEPAADISSEYTAAAEPMGESAADPEGEPAAEPVEESAAAFEPVGAELGDYYVEVVGVESFDDHLGAPAVRVYYDFTNNADEVRSGSDIYVTAQQNGSELAGTYAHADDDVDEYGNDWLNVYPGVTIRCIEEMSCSPDEGGLITVALEDLGSGESMTVEVDAGNLPGAPAEARAIETIAEPGYTAGWAAEGTYSAGYFKILRAEVVDAADYTVYDQVIRFYIEYTNHSEELSSCWWDSNFSAYQDGVQLDTSAAAVATDEDGMYDTDIAPGETAECAVCFGLRSDSPVELALVDTREDVRIGFCAEAG